MVFAIAVMCALSTLWPSAGAASAATPGSATALIALSHSVQQAAKKKAKKKKRKHKAKKKKKTLCVKKRKNKKGKKVTVFKTIQIIKRVKRGGRFVTVRKKKRVPVMIKCNGGGQAQSLGVPVKITIDSAKSYATLDFYSFTRQAPISGTITGYIPGSYVQGQANTVILTHGHIAVAQTPVFIDDVCSGQVSAAIQTGKQTSADVDASKKSTTTISPSGALQGSLSVNLHVNIELRHGDQGCNLPYLTTGYTDYPVTFRLFGKLFGFTTTIDTPDTILDNLGVCIWPGADTQPCGGYIIPLPIGLATHVSGAVSIG